ncbi:RNase H domain-containing protein [Trichonephila clavipes]|nr:RNase H domain-containing protein [Trichonephila clavipes]
MQSFLEYKSFCKGNVEVDMLLLRHRRQYKKLSERKRLIKVMKATCSTRRVARQVGRYDLSWIPSHIDLEGNEIADTLAKAGACEVPEPSAPLTFWGIFSRTKHQNKTAWITPPSPEHYWYQCSRPGGSLPHGFTRQNQTLLARSRSGHIKSMKFSEGRKSFEMCTNCSSKPATPAHILECLGLTKQDLADVPLLVLDFLKVYDVIDLV